MNTERRWIVGSIIVQVVTLLLLFVYLKNAFPGVSMKTPAMMIRKYKLDTSPKILFRASWGYLFSGKLFGLFYLYALAKNRIIFSKNFYIVSMLTMVNMVLWMIAYGFEEHFYALLTMVAMSVLCFIHVFMITKRYVDSETKSDTSTYKPLPETSTWLFRHLIVYPNVFSAWWGVESITFSLAYFLASLIPDRNIEEPISGTSSLVFFGTCQILWTMADFCYLENYTRFLSCVYIFIMCIAGGVLAINYNPDIGFTTNHYMCAGMFMFALVTLYFRYNLNETRHRRSETKAE